MTEQMFDVIWVALGAAFFFGMIAQLRLWSVARDLGRIADALEGTALRDQDHQIEPNEVRQYLE